MATCDLKFISNKTLTQQSITDYSKKNPDPDPITPYSELDPTEKEKRKSKIMKQTDTLHDMHSTGRGIGDSADIQETITEIFNEHDGVDAATFMAISTVGKGDSLIEGTNYYYGSDTKATRVTPGSKGTPGSSGRGSGLSNLENTMAKFFDETYDLPSLCKSEFLYGKTLKFTIYEIMADPDKFIDLMTDKKNVIDVIQIQVPLDKEEKQKLFKTPANQAKIQKVAEFILKFFFPEHEYGKVLFPVDAKSGPLPCIFQDIRDVGNLATALTIGDSATGGVDEKKNKSESALSCSKQSRDIAFNQPYQPLFFPFTDIPNRRYDFDSQEFTKGIYKIYYTEKAKRPFNSQNKDSMVLVVERIPTAAGGYAVWKAPFELSNSGSTLSGVGVPTLKKLITIIEAAARPAISISQKPKPKPKRIPLVIPDGTFDRQLDISPIIQGMWVANETKKNIIGFLFDYKRGGDYEQINSSLRIRDDYKFDIIFSTGDELCAEYGKDKKLNMIYVHDEFLTLTRFLKDETMTPVERDALNNSRFVKTQCAQLGSKWATYINPALYKQVFDDYGARINEWIKRATELKLDGHPELSIGFLFNVCYCYINHRIENVFKKVNETIVDILVKSIEKSNLWEDGQDKNELLNNFVEKNLVKLIKLLKDILTGYQTTEDTNTKFAYGQKDKGGTIRTFTVNMEILVDKLSIFDDKFWATIKYMNETKPDVFARENDIGIEYGKPIKNIPKTKLNCPLFNVNLEQINTALNGILSIMSLPPRERSYAIGKPIAEMGLSELNDAWATLLASYNVNVNISLELGDIPDFYGRDKYIAIFIERFSKLNEWYKECPTENIEEELGIEIDEASELGMEDAVRMEKEEEPIIAQEEAVSMEEEPIIAQAEEEAVSMEEEPIIAQEEEEAVSMEEEPIIAQEEADAAAKTPATKRRAVELDQDPEPEPGTEEAKTVQQTKRAKLKAPDTRIFTTAPAPIVLQNTPFDPHAAPANGTRGAKKRNINQGGGALTNEASIEIGDILFDISSSALNMIQSIYSELYPALSLQQQFNEYNNEKDQMLKSLIFGNMKYLITTNPTIFAAIPEVEAIPEAEAVPLITTYLTETNPKPPTLTKFYDDIIAEDKYKDDFTKKYTQLRVDFTYNIDALLNTNEIDISELPFPIKLLYYLFNKTSIDVGDEVNFSDGVDDWNGTINTANANGTYDITYDEMGTEKTFTAGNDSHIILIDQSDQMQILSKYFTDLADPMSPYDRNKPLYNDVEANYLVHDYEINMVIFFALLNTQFIKNDYFTLGMAKELLYTSKFNTETEIDDKLGQLIVFYFKPPAPPGGGSKTRRKKRPLKKRIMKTKRNNKNKQSNNKQRSNAKKRNSKKLKKKNRKKRTTRRKK